MERIAHTSVIGAPIDAVWEFHMDPHNIARVGPPDSTIRILTEDPVIAVGRHIAIEMTLWHFYPVVMENEIAECEPPRRFVDVQIRGPVAYYRHEHLFEQVEGGTRMTDIVEYESDGVFGRIADSTIIRRKLEQIMEIRHRRTAEILEQASDG